MKEYALLNSTCCQRVSDAEIVPILNNCSPVNFLLVLVLPQLGDFDSLEYAWWLQKEAELLAKKQITVRAVGIGDRASGERFCDYTGFDRAALFVDPDAKLHQKLNLYSGLDLKFPGFSKGQNAWLNLILMCAGIGSPGTLKEVFRGYLGDRSAPQLIEDKETVQAPPLPAIEGSLFNQAGGNGFQRPFELATLRLRNMGEVLSNWNIYVPNPAYLTQRGATFLFDSTGELIYQHRDRNILGFAKNMSRPLEFLQDIPQTKQASFSND